MESAAARKPAAASRSGADRWEFGPSHNPRLGTPPQPRLAAAVNGRSPPPARRIPGRPRRNKTPPCCTCCCRRRGLLEHARPWRRSGPPPLSASLKASLAVDSENERRCHTRTYDAPYGVAKHELKISKRQDA